MNKGISRRIFLRGLGGACLAAPFLGSLRPLRAESVAPGKRLIVMFTHYGCVTNRFFPTKSHGPLSAADLESTTLKHLAPFVDKLLLPRGIRAMNEWTVSNTGAGNGRGQGNDPHQAAASYFTCHPLTPNNDSPFGLAPSTRFVPKSTGTSLDHVMAKQLSPNGTPLLISTAGVLNEQPRSAISYSAPETLYPAQSVANVFSRITGLFQQGAPLAADAYKVARGKSILDVVRDDLDTLQRFDMSQSDRHKLEHWKSLVDSSGQVMAARALECSLEGAAALGVTEETLRAARTSIGADALTHKVTETLDGADLCSNVAVLAALCNVNPVIFLKYPASYVFQGLGITIDSHSLSHRLDTANLQGTCLPGALDMLETIDDYYARKFTHLVAELDRIDEGDGKLLDNTAAVWFQEMSDGIAHNLNNLPVVQAGSAGGYFKTGWAVNVDDSAPDLTTGNSEFYCAGGESSDQVDGISQKTGTDPSLANAPINKYFCNLMKALGVKAGSDGFPMVGGTEEVTHFGKYDKTEDFAGGDVNPPAIHFPGAFTALEANG